MKRSVNASLKPYNSFALEAHATQILVLENSADLQTFASELSFDPACDLVLGGGSNILFAADVEGTVILNHVLGKKIIEDHGDTVLLEACAGENWHELVSWSLDQGYCGLENLSLIPGLCGAAPVQNIGAYGVELSDVLESVTVLDLQHGNQLEIDTGACQLGYRDSRFKSTDADRYLVTHIRLRLQRQFEARLDYPDLRKELETMGIQTPTARQVGEAVIRLRQRKLPDPTRVGNAGSFFKNPVIEQATADNLKRDFPDLPLHPTGDGTAKLSAAWLIEQCGWKGHTLGGAAVSEQHALVLVNRDNATGLELLELATAIKQSVQHRFGVVLETEPRIVKA